MFRRVLFQLHWFLGITAGLVLAVMGITGATMSFEDEMSEALSPRVYVPGVPAASDLSPDRMIAELQAANPGYYVSRLDWQAARERSHTVRMTPVDGGERKQGQVDRTSGAWLAQAHGTGFFHVMDETHRYLALPGGGNGIGRQITGFSALALIFFALSGLYLRWPRKALDWREWLVLDWRKTGRNLWRALHVTIGTWVLLFYLLSAFTGLWWSYDWYRQGVVYALTGKAGEEEGDRAKRTTQPAPRPPIDPAWTAFLRDGGARYAWVRITQPAPGRPMKTIQFDARPAGARHLRQTDKFSYDPRTYQLKKRDLYDKRSLGLVITQSMFEIHRGAFFGLPVRIAILLTSLTMPLFTITGYLLYLSRRKRKQEARSLDVAPSLDARPANLIIAFASQTGTAEMEARNAVAAFAHGGLRAQIVPIGKLSAEILAGTTRILFVVSTYGDGEPPDMAHGFTKRLMHGAALDLRHLDYGVLALGDREYPDFCGYGRALEAWLARSGAQPLFGLIEMDHGDEAAHYAWQAALRDLGAGEGTRGQQLIALEPWTLVSRKLLNAGSSHLKAFHLRFEPPSDSIMDWEAGDIVEVQPSNAPHKVDALLASQSGDGDLLDGSTALHERLSGLTLPEAGSRLDADALPQLHPLPVREYSAASITADGTLDLVVRQVRSDDGEFGVGSGWLTAHLPIGGTSLLRVRPNPGFRQEADGRRLILIGNGTGIAGLRAHLRAQAHAGRKGHWLLFGERSRAHEAYFDDELLSWQLDGTLARLDRAFSRDPDCGRYVQDLLLDAGDEVRTWIDRGAIILVCGSLAGMAREVHDALATLIGTAHLDRLAEDRRYLRDVY